MYPVDNFEEALFDTTHRIVAKAVVLSEQAQNLTEVVRELLTNEAPQGIPLDWVMHMREVAASLGQDGPDKKRQTLLRRVGDAIVEAIDEGEISGL